MAYTPSRIKFIPGINPEPDSTNQNTLHIIDGDNIRFYQASVEKLGGHVKEPLSVLDLQGANLGSTLSGCGRALRSYSKDNKKWQIEGTHTKLYAKLGGDVWNITPLKTTATATLGADPLDTTDTDETLTVNYTAHGLAVGDRIKLTGATDVGGITAANDINREHIIGTVPDANSFTIELENAATSTASGGGASIEIFTEIDAGGCDAVNATGYGVGTYGTNDFGESQTDTTLFVQPRIWWMDVFGTTLVCGAGQGGKCYQWLSDVDTAPTVITNAPDADWGWVEDAKLVTLKDNIIKNSNTGDLTDWTPAAGSSAYEDTKEDAHKLIGRAFVNGENLIFAEEKKIFRLRWVGGTVKWSWVRVDAEVGIMSPNSYVVRGGVCIIFGRDDVYSYNGGMLQPIPNNTLRKYLYEDINTDQRFKFFSWHNGKPYNEVHMHYASANSDENDRAVIFHLYENWWSKRDSIERTAVDRGGIFDYPILCAADDGTYQHEIGKNDDGAALNAYVQIAYQSISSGKVLTEVYGMEPDLIQAGDATVELYGKDRSKNDGVLLESFTLTEAQDEIECEHETRWRSWLYRSNTVDGDFRWGGMMEYIQKGAEF